MPEIEFCKVEIKSIEEPSADSITKPNHGLMSYFDFVFAVNCGLLQTHNEVRQRLFASGMNLHE